MTPEEIRQHSQELFEQLKDATKPGAPFPDLLVSALVHQTQANWEVAAQLAELNQGLRLLPSRFSDMGGHE